MNNYTKLFEEFLELTEFTLIKYKSNDEEYNPWRWGVIDRQGANLGDIMSDRFSCAEDIIDRFHIYINDYIYRDLEEELDAYEVDLDGRELPWGAETWLALRGDKEFYKKNRYYFDEHKWEFDVLDMIAYHTDEINLEECYYEREE